MRIDAHQHFWKYNRDDYPWIPQSSHPAASDGRRESTLDRDFLPDDLYPLLQSARLDGCIAVQARQSWQENEFLVSLAVKSNFVLGVVGWIDLRSADVEVQAQRFAAHPKAVGVRHVVQDEAEPMFMTTAAFRRGIACLARHQLVYDILIYDHQLPDAVALVRAFPDQSFVLDHLAKPKIKLGQMDPWQLDLQQLAEYPNVAVKVSGMVTEADHRHWQPRQLFPFWDTVLNAFGPERILFGSDWPVMRLASTYEGWISLVDQWLTPLSDVERAAIWGQNAQRIYFPDTQLV